MRIGIMGAMPQEIQCVQKYMQNIKVEKYADRDFIQGQINGTEIMLVFSRWGKVAAASTAATLIDKYNVKKIIFSGVAGAVSPELNIGDVVISEKLYQHDMNAAPLMRKHEVPLTGITFFSADTALIAETKKATTDLVTSLNGNIKAGTLRQFKITNPKVVCGTIATGDEFIHSKERAEDIRREQPEAIAVEMEGAAVAQICFERDIPFVVIRTISDTADHCSKIDFEEFVNQIATNYSEHIITRMLGMNP